VFEQGEWLRAVSAAFLHRDPTHFFRVVPLTAILASILERRIGSLPLIALSLLCAIVSAATSLFLSPDSFVTVGASGAMFGMVGFLFGALVRPTAIKINPWVWLTIVVCFVVLAAPSDHFLASLINDRYGPDYGGNLAGLLAGVMAALALAMIPRRSPPPGL
jgi:membrane associated rhomboid family serine protease